MNKFARKLLVVCRFAMLALLLGIFLGAEAANRDKSGTTRGFGKANDSQVALNKRLTSRVSFTAEGTRLELAIPYGTPHFQ